MIRPGRRNTPLSDPNRLPCGHLKSRRHWNPWCRFCIQGPKYNRRKWLAEHPNDTHPTPHHWRRHHKSKHRKSSKLGGAALAAHDLKVRRERPPRISPNSIRQRKLRHKEEMARISYILFHLGQGRIGKLPSREARLVSAHRDKLYSEYLTRQKFADRKTMTKHNWARKIWYCNLRLVYSRGAAKATEMEMSNG